MESKGIKRYITALISIAVLLAVQFPVIQPYVDILIIIGGLFGVTSLVHAAAAGTLMAFKTGTLASLFATLLALAKYIPALTPFIEILEILAGLFGATAVAARTTETQTLIKYNLSANSQSSLTQNNLNRSA